MLERATHRSPHPVPVTARWRTAAQLLALGVLRRPLGGRGEVVDVQLGVLEAELEVVDVELVRAEVDLLLAQLAVAPRLEPEDGDRDRDAQDGGSVGGGLEPVLGVRVYSDHRAPSRWESELTLGHSIGGHVGAGARKHSYPVPEWLYRRWHSDDESDMNAAAECWVRQYEEAARGAPRICPLCATTLPDVTSSASS
jgi:hypothetical protein